MSLLRRLLGRMHACSADSAASKAHLDRDPVDPYLLHVKPKPAGGADKAAHGSISAVAAAASPVASGLSKWRPIQAFVCLTDHFGGDSGGLRAVSGFHKRIDAYFSGKVSEGGGEFFRMHHHQHEPLQKACQPVVAPAGAMVFWDNRLPHATAAKLAGHDTREVVYTGFLPDVPLNRAYILRQLAAIRANRAPPAYEDSSKPDKSDRNWEATQLTSEQSELLGFNDHADKRK